MPPKFPKNAASVQEALDKWGMQLPNSTRIALDAASTIGCNIA